MFILNWLKQKLQYLGLKNKNAKIVFFGLDDAGKSSLLLMLKYGVMKQLDPTQHPYSEQLVLDKIRFKAWDLGGHDAARKTWKNYVADIDGIVYIVDSKSRIQLQGVLSIPQIQKIPIVILGNKIDKAGAVPQYQLRQALGLQQKGRTNYGSKQTRPLELFMCSIPKRIGYADGFKWLSKYLK